MKQQSLVCGIDVGSVSVSVALLDLDTVFVQGHYQFHDGKPFECLYKIFQQLELENIRFLACTSSTPSFVKHAQSFDNNIAAIAAAKKRHPHLGSLLIVGGEKFSLTNFNQQGEYSNSYANSPCASGTGSFLDQQSKRLGLEDSATLSAAALEAGEDIPKIATRCAVFAKTDLLHAQQEGYALSAICNGLCRGLAINIIDTLFKKEKVNTPVVFAGGVALNKSVVKHANQLLDTTVIVDDQPQLYGAMGAAYLMLDLINATQSGQQHYVKHATTIDDFLSLPTEKKKYYHDNLRLEKSTYPEFSSLKRYDYQPQFNQFNHTVEVDIYFQLPPDKTHRLYMGIDIGSTSTKAVLVDEQDNIVIGLYTRTSGKPLIAIQALFETIDRWSTDSHITLILGAVGTTGAGRKFIGAVIDADLVIDEITAHAKAAYKLNPEIDTIIEIGGQDAKFTTMRNGNVTFSVMNNVCAAGTGSFIEEQAHKLGCKLEEYAKIAYNAKAPMSSDRCTVFMERDLNHFLQKSYSLGEILASILHSVRENYLTKVARGGKIGNKICFQGATAKNKALIAAFEQKLEKTIYVSKYCHLTGALGVVYLLKEEATQQPGISKFKGIAIYKQAIPIRNEICDLCSNHCKLRVAEIGGVQAAYGFLCGRDYQSSQYVVQEKSAFNLLKEHKKAFPLRPPNTHRHMLTIGLPYALFMVPEAPLWQSFFSQLGVKTVTSEKAPNVVSEGKSQSGAEFCGPIDSFHGHISYLADKADYIFSPTYLEEKANPDALRLYCYYTQFSNMLVSSLKTSGLKNKCLTPVLRNNCNDVAIKKQLLATLKPAIGDDLSFSEVSAAYTEAHARHRTGQQKLKNLFQQKTADNDDLSVMLIGRPYTILSPSLNKGIPDIFDRLRVKAFFMDMIDHENFDFTDIDYLLSAIHWKYAADILKAARVIAEKPNVYPVYITSFMCNPDSCTIEYFKRIMDKYNKPYLILQLDEHDSSVGYETRIESAIRSFQNHQKRGPIAPSPAYLPINPILTGNLTNKKLFLPNWEDISCRLLVANLRREGIDAYLLPETELTIQKSLQHNTGQCTPLTAIVQDFIDHIQESETPPEDAILWTPQANLSCSIRLYPYYAKTILESCGQGMEKAQVYVGESNFIDISLRASSNAYFAYMFGGLLKKVACKIRPYERTPGLTNQILEESVAILEDSFLGKTDKLEAIKSIIDQFQKIETLPGKKPQVAIFGDMYVRDNPAMNQNLIKFIETHGGEAVITPYTEFAKIIAPLYFKHWLENGKYIDVFTATSLLATLKKLERKYIDEFEKILGKFTFADSTLSNEAIVKRFGITLTHRGETIDNLLKVFHLLEVFPDISLFVQTNPSFCCPSLITEAMSKEIEKVTGVPIVSVTYDATLSSKNEIIIPYLKYPRKLSKTRAKFKAENKGGLLNNLAQKLSQKAQLFNIDI